MLQQLECQAALLVSYSNLEGFEVFLQKISLLNFYDLNLNNWKTTEQDIFVVY